jgi:putative protease
MVSWAARTIRRSSRAGFPKHRGLFVGRVAEVGPDWVRVVPDAEGRAPTGAAGLPDASARRRGSCPRPCRCWAAHPTPRRVPPRRPAALRAGQGVVFDAGHPEDQHEPAARCSPWTPCPTARGGLGFGRPGPDLSRVHRGDRVWLTSDPALNRRADKLVSGEPPEGPRSAGSDRDRCARRARLTVARPGPPRARLRRGDVQLARSLRAATGSPRRCSQTNSAAFGGTCFRLGKLDVVGLAPGLHTARVRAQAPAPHPGGRAHALDRARAEPRGRPRGLARGRRGRGRPRADARRIRPRGSCRCAAPRRSSRP